MGTCRRVLKHQVQQEGDHRPTLQLIVTAPGVMDALLQLHTSNSNEFADG
jgi:hypothetical protein